MTELMRRKPSLIKRSKIHKNHHLMVFMKCAVFLN